MKKDVFLLLLCFVALTVCAQDPVEYKGLWYTLDVSNSIATVVANPTGDGYSGEVVIPDAVEYGGKTYDVARIGDEAFCGTNILSVTIGDKLSYIGKRAFAYSTVTSAVIGKGVQNVGDFAFYDCRRLTDVIIGNGENNENYGRIGESAFHHCTSLSSIVLGKSVRWIYPSAFYDCQNLKDVYCLGDYIWAAYGNIPYFERDLLDGMTLHVLPSSFFSYHPESDYLWSEYPWSEFKKTVIMESDELSWLEGRLHRK
jgi:hypothetical protein